MKALYILLFFILIKILLIHPNGYSQNIISSGHYDNSNKDKKNEFLRSIDSLDKAIDQFQKVQNLEKIAFSLSEKADKFIEMGQVDLAKNAYLKQVDIAEQIGNDTLAFSGYEALRVIYIMSGDFNHEHNVTLKYLSSALKSGNPTKITKAYADLALNYLKKGLQDSINYCFHKALSYSKQASPIAMKNLYSNLGYYYYNKGDYEGGLIYYLKAIDIDVTLSDSASFLPNDLNFVAKAFIKLKNYDKAEKYAEQAYQLCVKYNLKMNRVNVLYYFGEIKLYKGDTLGAIRIYKESIPLLNAPKNYNLLKKASEQLAKIYILNGNLKEAHTLLQEAAQLKIDSLDPTEYIRQQIIWGHYYLKNKETIKAIKMLKNALDDAQKRGLTSMSVLIYPLLYKAYAQNGQYQVALQNLETYNRVNDSINEKSRAEVMLAIESRFELKEKNQTISDLNSEALLNKARIESSKTLQFVLGIGFFLTTLLSGLVFYFYQIKHKQAEELELKNVVITKAYTEKDLLLREIHHRVKNNLQVVSSLLRLQSRHVQDNHAQEALLEGRNRVNSMALIHQYLYRDEDITKISADEYIKKLATTLYKSYDVSNNRIKFQAQIDPIKLDVDTAIPIGLILNELITNALKHAFPNQREGILEVTLLRGSNDEVNLSVKDNGVGFTEKSLKEAKESFGWSLVELFSEKLNAQLSVSNGVGTTVNLQFLDRSYVA
jgi:two-component system, sensor histidine kinase PdtaS